MAYVIYAEMADILCQYRILVINLSQLLPLMGFLA